MRTITMLARLVVTDSVAAAPVTAKIVDADDAVAGSSVVVLAGHSNLALLLKLFVLLLLR